MTKQIIAAMLVLLGVLWTFDGLYSKYLFIDQTVVSSLDEYEKRIHKATPSKRLAAVLLGFAVAGFGIYLWNS